VIGIGGLKGFEVHAGRLLSGMRLLRSLFRAGQKIKHAARRAIFM